MRSWWLAVCWYLRYGLSYRAVEELLAQRGIEVDHVTIYRWAQRFTSRDLAAAHRFFIRAVEHGPRHAEVTTDRAPVYPRVIEELISAACRVTEQYTSNPVEADRA
jgi:transposase-like protein